MNRNLRGTILLFSCLVIAACSSDVQGAGEHAGGGGAGASGGGNTGGDATAGPGGTGGTGGGGGSGPTACSDARPCGEGEYCDYFDGLCGAGQPTGMCAAEPKTDCGPPGPPVCGCDGNIYLDGQCAAGVGGTDVAPATSCKAPAGTFACGSEFCTTTTQYCATEIEIGVETDECSTGTHCKALATCEGSPAVCSCIESRVQESWRVECSGDTTVGVSATLASLECGIP